MFSRLVLPMALLVALAVQAATAAAEPPDPAALARRLDERLRARFQQLGIEPAPASDDAEFLRRVSLDIAGCIPRAADVYAFLADRGPDKRHRLVDRLLDEPRHAIHFSHQWRAELLPEATTNGQAAQLERGFENWLAQQRRAGARYDQLVRELIAAPLPASGLPAEPVLRDPERPNPLAFLAAKDARPENLAAAVTRTFLGIQLECAQCHNHPFARWSQDQFWSQAAFFAGLEKQTSGLLSPLAEAVERREIASPDGGPTIAAAFLSAERPQWQAGRSPRAVLADWITSPENPYFAHAAVNRIWGQFFGFGIVDPVDDFHDDNPPSDPELLDELAAAFTAAEFDLSYLIRAICLTEAYQRTSRRTHASQDETRLPARMTVKAMTADQFYDSLALAALFDDEADRGQSRRMLVSRFALAGPIGEPETSVQQALTLLNGRFVGQTTDTRRSPLLVAVTKTPHLATRERIETLYVATLSRLPTGDERQRLASYVAEGAADEEPERLADVLWMLLNCAEFRLNH